MLIRLWKPALIIVFLASFIFVLSQLTLSDLSSDSTSTSEWRMFGRTLNHSFYDGQPFSVIDGLIIATYDVDLAGAHNYGLKSPSVANGYVYIGSTSNNIYQLNASNISQKIAEYDGAYLNSFFAITNEYVYFGGRGSGFYQLNASNISQQINNYAASGTFFSSPAVANGYVYSGITGDPGTNPGKLYQFNASNISQKIAEYTTDEVRSSSPAVANGYVYFGSSRETMSNYQNNIYQLNASNVSQKIANYSTGGAIHSSPAVANGYVYIGSGDNKTYQLNASNISQKIAEYTMGGSVDSSPAVANGYVYIGCNSSVDNNIYQLNASNISQKIANYPTGGAVVSSPAVANGYVYVGSGDGKLYQLNASNISQKIYEYATSDRIDSSPAVANGYVYFSSNNGKLYQINASNISLGNEAVAPHTIALNAPADGASMSVSSVTFNWTAYDNDDINLSCNLTINGLVYASKYSPNGTSTTQLVENILGGAYLWNVTCKDDLGNINTSETRRFTISLLNSDSTSTSEWRMFGRTLNHSFYDGQPFSVIGGLNIAYFTTGDAVNVSVAVANGYVYVGSNDNKIYQLNASNISQKIAEYVTGRYIRSSPAVANGYVYIASADYKLYQLNASNISQKIADFNGSSSDGTVYEQNALAYEFNSPIVANGFVYASSVQKGTTTDQWGRMYQLNASNISQIFAIFQNGFYSFFASPTIANSYIYAAQYDTLYQLNASNISQSIITLSLGVMTAPAISNGFLYVGKHGPQPQLYQLNASNVSQQIATYSSGGEYTAYSQSSPAIANNYVYVGSTEGKVYQLNASNASQKIAEYTTGGDVQSSPAIANGYVYIGSNDNKLYQLNASNISQKIGEYVTNDKIVSSPAVANGYVYFGSKDGRVYQINASNISLGNEAIAPHTIALNAPADGASMSLSSVTFNWTAYDNADINLSCNLTIGGTVNVSKDSLNGTTTAHTVRNISDGAYLWNITCKDDAGNTNVSETRSFTIDTLDEALSSNSTSIYEWRMEGRNLNNNRYYPDSVNLSNFNLLWSVTVPGTINFSSPAIANGMLYIGTEGTNKTYAFNATTGAHIWNYTAIGRIRSSPAIAGGIVYIANDNCRDGILQQDDCTSTHVDIYALNSSNGQLIWQYETNGTDQEVFSSLAVSGGLVYVPVNEGGFGNGKTYALNALTGAHVWNFSIHDSGAPLAPAVEDGKIFFETVSRQYAAVIYSLNASNGELIWNYNLSVSDMTIPLAIKNKTLYFISGDFGNGVLYALNISNGMMIVNFTILTTSRNPPLLPTIIGSIYYYGAVYGAAAIDYALNLSTGEQLWNFTHVKHVGKAPLSTANDIIFTTDIEGNIYALNASTGSLLWNYTVNTNLTTSTAMVNGTLFLAGADYINGTGTIYAFQSAPDYDKPHTIALYSPSSGYDSSSSSVTFNWTAYDSVDNNLMCNLTIEGVVNGSELATLRGVLKSYAVNLTDKDYEWNVTCKDETGNANVSETRSFSVDTTSPIIDFVTPTTSTGNTSQTSITANVSANDTHLSMVTISLRTSTGALAGSASSASSPLLIQFSNLGEGTYYLNATAADSLGHSNSTETRAITIDTGGPRFVDLTGISINSTATLAHTIRASDSREVNCFRVSDEANFSINCSGYLTNATALAAGAIYPLNITVNDSLNNQRTALIYIVVLSSSQTYTTNSTITATENTTEIVMDTNNLNLSRITIPSTVSVSTLIYLNIAPLLGNANATIGSNNIRLERATATLNYSAEIPAGTSITGKTDWDGKIELPRVNTSTFTPPSGTIGIVIDLGSSGELNFSQAVKVTLGGMSGKHGGWSRGTATITDITTECNSATSPTNIDAVVTRECYKDSGNDLIIWTYHFTTFAAYTPAATPDAPAASSGGSSGGGSAKLKNETVVANETENAMPEVIEEEKKQNEELPEEPAEEAAKDEKSPPELKIKRNWYIPIIILLIVVIFFLAIHKKKTIHKKERLK